MKRYFFDIFVSYVPSHKYIPYSLRLLENTNKFYFALDIVSLENNGKSWIYVKYVYEEKQRRDVHNRDGF